MNSKDKIYLPCDGTNEAASESSSNFGQCFHCQNEAKRIPWRKHNKNDLNFHLNNNIRTRSKSKPVIRKTKLKLFASKMLHENVESTNIDNFETAEVSSLLKRCSLKFGSNAYNDLVKNNNAVLNPTTSSKCFEVKESETHLTQSFNSLNLKHKLGHNKPMDSSYKVKFSVKWEDRRNGHSSQDLEEREESHIESVLPDLNSLSLSESGLSCAEQARSYEDVSTEELAAYLDNFLHFPKEMSFMAEMMYT